MMKKEKTLRMAVTGALLLTVVAAGISMYRTDTTPKKEGKAQQEQAMQEEDSKDVTSKDAEAQDTGELARNTTEIPEAIRKAEESAKRNMITVSRDGTTIPHRVIGKFSKGSILMMPAGLKSKFSRTISVIFSSESLPVPKVSTITEVGCATPIA